MHAVLMHIGMMHPASLRDALVHLPASALHVLLVHFCIDMCNMRRCIDFCSNDDRHVYCSSRDACGVHALTHGASCSDAWCIVHQVYNALHVMWCISALMYEVTMRCGMVHLAVMHGALCIQCTMHCIVKCIACHVVHLCIDVRRHNALWHGASCSDAWCIVHPM